MGLQDGRARDGRAWDGRARDGRSQDGRALISIVLHGDFFRIKPHEHILSKYLKFLKY